MINRGGLNGLSKNFSQKPDIGEIIASIKN